MPTTAELFQHKQVKHTNMIIVIPKNLAEGSLHMALQLARVEIQDRSVKPVSHWKIKQIGQTPTRWIFRARYKED